ncbi:hypothetical protein DY000_02045665 [Brassica cretica]|uniref:DUF4005 domain-containing protein n=1 Tax=Brassica cretica TaxID=69181 RepID=A0ABQ7EMQ1_BRACR|nr:hypothetical protein DY000_02045665 [Brassica cretica]
MEKETETDKESDSSTREDGAYARRMSAFVSRFSRVTSAQGVPDPSSDDLGLFNLSSETRRSQTARGQLTTRYRDPISTLDSSRSRSQQSDSSRQHQLAFRSVLACASAQGVPDSRSDDLGLFNLSSQTRRSQTARGQLATRSARWTARIPDLSTQTARNNISSRSDQFQLTVHLFGGPFNPT